MRLIKTICGYRCASDARLQFHRLFEGEWEVRLSGRCGGHEFPTLAEAESWARQHWQPWFMRFLGNLPEGAAQVMLSSALQGDEIALLMLLDWVEDQGRLIPRKLIIFEATKAGMFRPRQRRAPVRLSRVLNHSVSHASPQRN